MSCPSLAKLSLSTGVYSEDKEKAWIERDDLIVGGCKRTSPCFEQWREALLNEALVRKDQHTIVLLSVGAGVLELLALRAIWEIVPLERVWLIDPGLDRAKADQVTKEMQGFLPGVKKIVYFAEKTAYADAMAQLDAMGNNEVIAVGALNKSFGIWSHLAESIQERLEPLRFVEKLNEQSGKNNKDGEHPMRFIEAYVDMYNGRPKFRKPWAEYWIATEKIQVADSMLRMSAITLRELDETTPDARGE